MLRSPGKLAAWCKNLAARLLRVAAIGGTALLCAVGVTGCGDGPQEIECSHGLRAVRAFLNGGVQSASYLGLSSSELDAVVQIVVLDPLGAPLGSCTGTLIAPRWVLSAAHCDHANRASVQVQRVDGTGTVVQVVEAGELHRSDEQDIWLVEVPEAAFSGVDPIAIAVDISSVRPGQRAQLAGTGYAEGKPTSSRLFSVARVVEIGPTLITVTADGYAGACDGDSGGPLLVRGLTGRPEVAGVLSTGSVTCYAEDHYQRVDTMASFIAAITGPVATEKAPCGELTASGRCFGSVSVWCDAGSLTAARCEAGESCGFDPAVGGFRCVQPLVDPCRGVGDLGDCIEGDALSCSDGHLKRNACSSCGAGCVVSPGSGRAVCVEGE